MTDDCLQAKMVESPCLKVVQLSATHYTAPVRAKTWFKDCAGPHSSMPGDYPWDIRALALTWPINCTGALCDWGISHKPFTRQSNGTNWLTMGSPGLR